MYRTYVLTLQVGHKEIARKFFFVKTNQRRKIMSATKLLGKWILAGVVGFLGYSLFAD